jgi:hypothetical protein
MTFDLFFYLLVGHAIADYPLQGNFLAKGKNHTSPLPGFPWQIILFLHALIHAGFVAYLTHSTGAGLFELGMHFMIDYLKCDGRTSFVEDQLLHILCKVIIVGLLASIP